MPNNEPNFIWLASYPKSGNTWLRVLLSNYLTEAGDGWNWGGYLLGPSSHLERHEFEETMGIGSADIAPSELVRFRRQFHEHYVRKFEAFALTKTHDSFISPVDGKPIFPAHPHCRAIYMLRNPLDIAASYAHHSGQSIDATIAHMADSRAQSATTEISFDEDIGNWSDHVIGWTEQCGLETLTVRYEDLLQEPERVFSDIILFCGLALDKVKVERAVRASQFAKLQAQERALGFSALEDGSRGFFRQGQAGKGKQELSMDQIDRVLSNHGTIMERFGYGSDS